MDSLLVFINTVGVCILCAMLVTLVIKNADAKIQLSQVQYLVNKPLFPYEMSKTDPLSVTMYHKRTLQEMSST